VARRPRSAARQSRRTAPAKRRPSKLRAAFAALPATLKVVLGAIGPLTALVGTLLALNIISPFQKQDAFANSVTTLERATSEVDITFASLDRRVSYSAHGVYDFASGHGVLKFELPRTSSGLAPSTLEVRFLRRLTYVAWPSDEPRWVRIDPATAPGELEEFRNDDGTAKQYKALLGLTVSDPSEVLADLHEADVEEIGDDTELGVATTRYEGRLPTKGAAANAPVVIVEIGRADGLVRMIALITEGGASAGKIEFRFARFGVDVDVDEPQGRSVIEFDELLATL
jgi:hypothetical protein